MSEPSPYREAAKEFCKKWKFYPENYLELTHAAMLIGAQLALEQVNTIQPTTVKPQ